MHGGGTRFGYHVVHSGVSLVVRKASIDAGLTNAATTLHNTAKASAKLGPLADRIGRAADAVHTKGTAVAKTSVNTGRVADGVGADVRRFSAKTRPQLEHLAGELSDLGDSLRLLTEQTRHAPKGLILGPTPVPDGPGESGEKP